MWEFEFPLLFPLSVDGLDKCFHPGGTFSLHFLGDMTIHIKGKRSRCVSQIFLDGFNVVTRLDAGNRIGVPQIMKASFGTSDFLCDLLE